MRRLILPALGLLILGVATQAAFSARGQGPADQVGWFLLSEDDSLKLVYGMANSDHVGLMLICNPGDLHVSVYGEVEPDVASLSLAQQGPTPMDPLSQGAAWGMTLSADDPGLWLLADKGYLPIRSQVGRGRLGANDNERQLANRFLNACTRQHA